MANTGVTKGQKLSGTYRCVGIIAGENELKWHLKEYRLKKLWKLNYEYL